MSVLSLATRRGNGGNLTSPYIFFFNQKSSLDKRVVAGCSPVATSPAPVLLAVPWEQLCSIPALGRSPGDSAAGCHSDGALAQHPSDSAGLAQVGREKNTPGMGTPPAAGLGKLRHGQGRRRGDGGGFWKLPMGWNGGRNGGNGDGGGLGGTHRCWGGVECFWGTFWCSISP